MSLWSACTVEEAIFCLMFMKDSRLEEQKFIYCTGNLHALEINTNNYLLLSISFAVHDIKARVVNQYAFIRYKTNHDHKLK